MTATTRNEAAERLYSAFGREWTIETGRTVNPDGTVIIESVTVEATVEAIKAAARRATVERIRARISAIDYRGPRHLPWDTIGVILDEEAAR